MLKIIFSWFLIYSLTVQSQTYQFVRTSPAVVGGSYFDTVIISYGKIINYTNQPVQIQLHRVYSVLPQYWRTSICDINTCYPKISDTTAFSTYPPGESEVKIKYYPDVHHNGIANVTVRSHLLNGSENYDVIFGATIDPIGIKIISSVADKYFLEQNYPNPFNPVTKIKFGIKEKEHVSVKIYNTTGELVTGLVNEILNTGMYEYEFDGSRFSSGVYYYTIRTDNYTEIKKMVLLK